jgi:hypothetical protein
MAINPNTNFSVSAVYTADQANRFPRGVMAYTQKTSSFTMTGTLADVGVSVTFTAEANRYYRYTAYAFASDASSPSSINLTIANSANTIISDGLVRTQGTGQYQGIKTIKVTTETAGTVVRKLRASSSSGSGTMYASAESPIFLLVEDIGPA